MANSDCDVYITNGYAGSVVEGAVLRCTEHPEWEKDVDGTPIETAKQYADEHVKDTQYD